MEPLLEIKDLHVEYKTGRATARALNGINLTIGKGEALGLVGETGAGKTTIALSTLKLLPQDVGKVTKGSIRFNGQSILDMHEKELEGMRGNKISMIFQNPLSSLNPLFTVGEQISMVLRKHNSMSKKEAAKKAQELLEMVGIAKYRLEDFPHQFSGGMRQRVGIAAALACNPELLIADEPTTALDVTIQAQILELMVQLKQQMNTAILLITHDMGVVAEMSDAVLVMYAGHVMEYANAKSLFQKPLHPYTQGLLASIPRMDQDVERLYTIKGNVPNLHNMPKGCCFCTRCPYASERCRAEAPETYSVEGHLVKCFLYEKEGAV